MAYRIAQAACRAGCPAATIRYYERVGLLPPPRRAGNGYRWYDEADIERLAFAVRARELGFSLDTVRELLELADHPARPCDAVDERVAEQRAAVRERIAHLTRLDARLGELQRACGGSRPVKKCGILAALSEG